MKVWAFWQKGVNYFWQNVDAILEYVSVAKKMFDAKVLGYLKDFHLSVFQKLR